jgi:hypothetical protein
MKMNIKFSCPHCRKPLTVKPELAGKRAQCPACKKVLTIPAPTARPADVEAFAAAALADKPKDNAPATESKTVEFNCYYCDAKVQVSAELAGKRAPCPECRRIVQVPLLEKQELKDWRKVDSRLPAGARRDLEPAPEGTWDARSAGSVSRESLLEAGAIVEAKERLTRQQWVKRGITAAAVLVVAGLISWWMMNHLARGRQERAVARALQAVETKGSVTADAAAEIHRAAGEYYFRAGKANLARDHFQKSRAAALPTEEARLIERECVLMDLAESLVDLGGDKPEVDKGMRVRWDDVQTEIRQTLQNLRFPEGRKLALQRVARKLIAKGQTNRAQALAAQFAEERAELLAVTALEMLRAKEDRKEIEKTAIQAQSAVVAAPVKAAPPPPVKPLEKSKPTQPPKPGAEKPKKSPPPPSLITVWLALGEGDKAKALAPPPSEGKASEPSALVGYASGAAWQGNWALARQVANNAADSPQDRLAALIAVASVAIESPEAGADHVRASLEEALRLIEGDLKAKEIPPWLLFQLVQLGTRAGMADRVQAVPATISDQSLRGRAQLALLRQRLASTQEQAEGTWVEGIEKNALASSLGVEEIARHNGRLGGAAADGTEKTIEPMLAEPNRPFGFIGLALGLQERDR